MVRVCSSQTSILPNLTTIMQYAVLKEKRRRRRVTERRADDEGAEKDEDFATQPEPQRDSSPCSLSSSSVEERSRGGENSRSASSASSRGTCSSPFVIVGNTHLFFHPYARVSHHNIRGRSVSLFSLSIFLSLSRGEGARYLSPTGKEDCRTRTDTLSTGFCSLSSSSTSGC